MRRARRTSGTAGGEVIALAEHPRFRPAADEPDDLPERAGFLAARMTRLGRRDLDDLEGWLRARGAL